MASHISPISSTSDALSIYLTHIASQLSYRYVPMEPLPLGHPSHAAGDEFSSQDLHAQVPKSGRGWISAVQEYCGSFSASSTDFLAVVAATAQKNYEETMGAGGTLLILGSREYPGLLGEISDPPLVLAVLGDPDSLHKPGLSVVGSRKASGWGLRESVMIGRLAALRGATVVSGGAFGCDIAAHRGMLRSGQSRCQAVVVMASGLGNLYPRPHNADFRALVDRGGALVSERVWWGLSKPYDFLVRNRIIAGLSPLTVVAEAGERSGALTTARIALDQGRDVAVLSGNENDVRSKGNQQLISEGAPAFKDAVCLMESRLLQWTDCHHANRFQGGQIGVPTEVPFEVRNHDPA